MTSYASLFLLFLLLRPCLALTANRAIDDFNDGADDCDETKEIFVLYLNSMTNYQTYAAHFGENNVKIMDAERLQVYTSCIDIRPITTTTTPSFDHNVNYSHHQKQLQSHPAEYRRKKPSEKLHRRISRRFLEFVAEERVVVQVTSFTALKDTEVRDELGESLLEVGEVEVDAEHLEHVSTINVSRAKLRATIDKLSKVKSVAWIETRQPYTIFNKFAKGVIEAGYAGSRFLQKANFTGAGHIVGVADTGVDASHCFFRDDSNSVPYNSLNLQHRKIVYYRTYVDSQDDSHGHGTHVAASLAGSYGNHDYNGVLVNAKLAFFDIGDASTQYLSIPGNLASQMLLPMYRAGARVFSNSWGAYGDGANYYSTDARSVDLFMYHYPEALVIFAAGNEGTSGYNSVTSPSLNKNGLSVGSSCNDATSFSMNNDIASYDHLHVNERDGDSNFTIFAQESLFADDVERHTSSSNVVDRVAYFSAKGPTADGRLKPDVVGPGWSIVSAGCGTDCGLTKMRGTSMATPIVAAAAIHIKDYFQKGFYPTGKSNNDDGFTPSGALIKAMLIHATTPIFDVANSDGDVSSLDVYPNREAGYGRIQLNRVLNFGASSRVSLIVIGSAYEQNVQGKRHSKTLFSVNRGKNLTTSAVSTSTEASSRPPIYVSLNQEKASFSYQFNSGSCSSKSDCSIRLTMCYTDVVGASGGDQILLNDLDMTVSSSSGDKLRPSTYFEDGPLESLTIQSPEENMNYTVTIYAKRLYTSQSFSLVITGKIVQFDNGFDWHGSFFGLWSWISGAFYQLGWWLGGQASNFINWYLSLDIFGMMMVTMLLSIFLSYVTHWITGVVAYILCCKWCCRRNSHSVNTGIHVLSSPQRPSPRNSYRNVIIYNDRQRSPPRDSSVDGQVMEASASVVSSATPLVHAQTINDLENHSTSDRRINFSPLQPSAPPMETYPSMTTRTGDSGGFYQNQNNKNKTKHDTSSRN